MKLSIASVEMTELWVMAWSGNCNGNCKGWNIGCEAVEVEKRVSPLRCSQKREQLRSK
jgi:hypothetical protein